MMVRYKIFLSLLLVAGSLNALPPKYIYTARTNLLSDPMSWSSAAADFNSDGMLDLVVGAYNGAGITQTLLGRGDGTFAPGTNVTAGSRPTSVAVGDFNADGQQDFATANEGDQSISIFLGNGNGTFIARSNLNLGFWIVSVAAADFNQDGRDDLAVANYGTGGVIVLQSLGDGDFAAPVNYLTDIGTHWVTVADVNKDGIWDLATANSGPSTGSVSVLFGNGDGTFLAASNYPAGPSTFSIAVGDVNNDGWPDLMAANWSPQGTVSIFRGLGEGNFAPATNIVARANRYPEVLTTGDFNGDGDLDLVATFNNTLSVRIMFGDGQRGFPTGTNISTASFEVKHVLPADVDADGRPDLIVVGVGPASVTVLLNLTSPTLKISPSANNVTIGWPRWNGLVLQSTAALSATNSWLTESTNAFQVVGNRNVLTNSTSGAGQFYRLIKP